MTRRIYQIDTGQYGTRGILEKTAKESKKRADQLEKDIYKDTLKRMGQIMKNPRRGIPYALRELKPTIISEIKRRIKTK